MKQNEAKAANVTDDTLAQQIRNQLDGITLTTLNEQVEQIPVRVQIKNANDSSIERLMSLPLLSEDGQVLPLDSVANWTFEHQIFNIHRRNSSRCNIIYAYVASGELPIVIENQFRQALKTEEYVMPPGYRNDFGGVSMERNSAVGNLLAYSVVIAVLMLSIMAMIFRSFRQAAIIATVALLSVGLGLLSLWIFRFPIGLFPIVGLLGMMGLAINDSIIVLSDVNAANSKDEPIVETIRHSTRHVLTTSITTIAGVLPLILAGGDMFPPMMIGIAGGVAGATILALVYTPAMRNLIQCRRNNPTR